MRIRDWSSDVCSSDLVGGLHAEKGGRSPDHESVPQPDIERRIGRRENAIECVRRVPSDMLDGDIERCRGRRRTPVHAGDELAGRSEEHTSELQSLMRISYAVFCLKKKNITKNMEHNCHTHASEHHDKQQADK